MNATLSIVLLAAASVALVAAMAPASIAFATPFTISWTAPGDDSLVGRASCYDLRYSSVPLTAATFNRAAQITGLPAPAPAGTAESFVVSGLSDAVSYYFAIKTEDDAGNWSAMSNVFTRAQHTAGARPPKAAAAFSFSSPWPNPARQSAQWSYSAPEAAQIQVNVFDATGRQVHTVASGSCEAGSGALSWDLRDDRGSLIAAGIYFVKTRLGPAEWTKRLVIVR
jgi:hypothetical protein